MRLFIHTVKFTTFAILLTATHVFFKIFLPFPINHINIIFLGVILALIFKDYSEVFILFLVPTFFIELFSVYPFGVGCISFILSISIIGWLLENIFTNHSVFIVYLIAALSVLFYHVFFTSILYLLHFILLIDFNFSMQTVKEWFVEIFITSTITALFYFIISFFTGRKRPHFVRM